MWKYLGPALCGVLALGIGEAGQRASGDTLKERLRSAFRRPRDIGSRRRETLFRILERYKPHRIGTYELRQGGRSARREGRERSFRRNETIRRRRTKFVPSESVLRRRRSGGTFVVRDFREGGMRVRDIKRGR